MAQGFQILLITERRRVQGSLPRAIEEALLGGVDCVQVREKGGPARTLYQTALELLPSARESGASLLINGHIDVALASNAGRTAR